MVLDTGWLDLGTFASNAFGGGGTAWSNPSNAASSDDADAASALINFLDTSEWLVATNPNPSIPDKHVITGVEIRNETAVTNTNVDWQLSQLVYSGALYGSPKTNTNVVTTVDTVFEDGGPADLWGAILTPDIVNDTSFGFAVRYINTDITFAGTATVDHLQIKLSYRRRRIIIC